MLRKEEKVIVLLHPKEKTEERKTQQREINQHNRETLTGHKRKTRDQRQGEKKII